MKRNAELENEYPGLRANSQDRLNLPFVLVNAPKNAKINCEMLEDRSQYYFDFDTPFQINEDIEILRLMGMGQTSREELKTFVPPELLQYLPQMQEPGTAATETSPSDEASSKRIRLD